MADFAADPLNFVGNVRAKTANELLKGFREVQQRQTELTLPLLALHGTQDHITSYPVRPACTVLGRDRTQCLCGSVLSRFLRCGCFVGGPFAHHAAALCCS